MQFQPFGKEKSVDRPLEALAEWLKEKHDGKGEDLRWTFRGVIDCLAQITRNRVAVNGAEFDQNSTPTPEQEQILDLLQVTM